MPNIGTIYRAQVGHDDVRYFWDVATDRTQLGSAIIVVFRRSYPTTDSPDLDAITADEVDFYCHTMVLGGIKSGLWSKVGYRRVTRVFSMLFRDSNDYGNPSVRVSDRWYVWKPNRPFRNVSRLTGDFTKAEIGVVVPPDCVIHRMRTGAYGIFYPAYEPGAQPCA